LSANCWLLSADACEEASWKQAARKKKTGMAQLRHPRC
jgi:hypothetical protein